MGYKVEDASLSKTIALPAAAGSVQTVALDLKNSAKGDFLADMEVCVVAPALGTTPLPNGETMKYNIQHSLDNSSFVTIAETILTQTGAAGAGAAAATKNFRLPVDVYRYVRAQATLSAGGADASASSVIFKALF